MSKINTLFNELTPQKIILMGVMALVLLIPLAMVKSQIRDREKALYDSEQEVASSWGLAQTLAGPYLCFEYLGKDASGENVQRQFSVYPQTLNYQIDAKTQHLHRSIYDINVYKADVTVSGTFVIPENAARKALVSQSVLLGFSDLRGIDGTVDLELGASHINMQNASDRESTLYEKKQYLCENIELSQEVMNGKTVIPFSLTYRMRGSSSLMVKPYGEITDVTMHADCPDPSFTGDFLPAERDINDEGFTAHWTVSKINRGNPDDTSFGVNLLSGVTQYQQTTRSAKYGILIILLVFNASLCVEFIRKKHINLVQYLIIGLSLVLFYALVLSFSEFMSFELAYLLATLMTVAALHGYFRGILRDRSAWILTLLVALAYLVSYLLLQMENYAFITGTLLLFFLLTGIMYLTRNLNRPQKN